MQAIPVVRDFMTTKVVTVAPDAMILDAIKVLLKHNISGAPVIESTHSGHKLVGILSEKDCINILTSGAYHGCSEGRVSDYMSTPVTTLSPELGIFAVADLFLNKHYRRMPVLDDEGQIIGIVSRRDLLEATRLLWSVDEMAPDSGYLTDAVKARLGDTGQLRRRTHI